MNSWCSRCALLTTRDGRLRDRGELARSRPGGSCRARSTAARCVGAQAQQRQRQADRVVEVARVASTAPSPKCARRIAASISLTVVLPLLPTTTDERQREPRAASARRARRAPRSGSATATRSPASVRARASSATSAATAPRASAAATKSWPSKRSPLSATKRSPGASVRRVGASRARSARCRRRQRAAPTARGGGRRVHHRAAPAPPARARGCASASENGVRTPSRSW